MKIKALSLWQPWASLVALGAKRFETRSWSTTHRGPLLICACASYSAMCRRLSASEPFRSALQDGPFLLEPDIVAQLSDPEKCLGMALCVVDVTAVFKIHELTMTCSTSGQIDTVVDLPDKSERAFGDYTTGRFAWQLTNVRTFKPFPIHGRQRLFNAEIDHRLLNEVPA